MVQSFPKRPVSNRRRYPLTATEGWTLLAIFLVLLYRFPDRLLAPQLWAEDGPIFLAQQRDLGIASLTTPYAGYLHILIRLSVLVIGSVVDLAYIPAAYNWVTLLLTLGTALFVMRARVPLPFKPLAAFALVFVPHPFEVYLTITNIQWIFAAALPLYLLQTPATTRGKRIGEAIAAFFLGLTGPFLLLYSPLLAYRFVRDGWKNKSNLLFCGAGVLAIAIQAYCVMHAPSQPAVPGFSPIHWLITNGAILLGGFVLGKNMAHFLLGDNTAAFLKNVEATIPHGALIALLAVAGIAALAAGIFLLRGILRLTNPRRALAFGLLLCAFAVYIAAMRRMQSDPQPIGPFVSGSRYCFLPYVYFVWTALTLYTAGGLWRAGTKLVLILEAVSTLSVMGPPPEVPDWHWAESVRRVHNGETVDAPIPPNGYGGMKWEVHLAPKKR